MRRRIAALALALAAPAWASGEPETRLETSSAEAPLAEPAAPDFRVELEVDDREPYVHGSVRLCVRLLAAEGFLEGGLSEPRIDGALVRRIGADRQTEREIDGRRYRVVEREYAVAPQRSGPLRIEPVVFEGLLPDPEARQARRGRSGSLIERFLAGSPIEELLADPSADPFFADPFGGSLLSQLAAPLRPVRTASAPLELTVRLRPAGAEGSWWLPARDVQLLEAFESDPPRFRVGEPVRRQVVLRAEGVAADQLPRLALPEPDGLSQYLEPAREDTRVEDGRLHALQVIESVLIPTRSGRLELPAVEVSWWDVEAERARTARLPSRSIQVSPGAASPADPAPAPPPRAEAAAGTPPAPGSTWIVPASAAALLLLGALGGAGLALRRRRRSGGSPLPPGRRQVERALARACRRGDARAAAEACRTLAVCDGVRSSLADHAERQGQAALAAALRQLDRVRYAPVGSGAERWDGRALWRAWRAGARRARRPRRAAAPLLPALYPEP